MTKIDCLNGTITKLSEGINISVSTSLYGAPTTRMMVSYSDDEYIYSGRYKIPKDGSADIEMTSSSDYMYNAVWYSNGHYYKYDSTQNRLLMISPRVENSKIAYDILHVIPGMCKLKEYEESLETLYMNYTLNMNDMVSIEAHDNYYTVTTVENETYDIRLYNDSTSTDFEYYIINGVNESNTTFSNPFILRNINQDASMNKYANTVSPTEYTNAVDTANQILGEEE